MRARWFVLIAAGVPACLFPSLDALTGSDASLSDVVVPTDAPVNDVTTADASPDAIVEAGCDVAADAGFCGSLCTPPIFCDDFDIDSTFTRWSDGLLTSNGSGSIQDGGISLPHLANYQTKAFDSGTAFAESRTQLPPTTVFTVELDANVNTPAAHYGLVSIETTAVAPYKTTRLFLDVSGTAFSLQQDVDLTDGGSSGGTTPISTSIPSGWFHLALTMDLNAHTLTLVVDKATLASNVPLDPGFVPSVFLLRAGIYFISAPGTFQKVQLDNVVVHAG